MLDPQSELDGHQQQPKPIVPVCGHCRAGRKAPWPDGAPLVMTKLTMGNLLIGVFACGNPDCGAIHSCQVLQATVSQQQRPLIQPPGGGMN